MKENADRKSVFNQDEGETTMSTTGKLRLATGTEKPDALREKLAVSIKAAATARDNVEKHKAAISQLNSEASAAASNVEAAQAGVERAKRADAAVLASQAAKGLPSSNVGKEVRKARDAVTEAEDRRDALIAARQQLESELPDLKADVIEADTDCERIISEIIAPVIHELAAKARAITARLDPIKAALLTFLNSDRPPTLHATDASEFLNYGKQRKPLEDAKAAAQAYFDDSSKFAMPDVNVWVAARRILRDDPFAPLPEIGV
jgi:hypothetical protein